MQISQFARFAQNYAVRVSEFVRKPIGRLAALVLGKPVTGMRLPSKYGFPALQVMHAYEIRPRRTNAVLI
jgi:hypothetical protein